ncbi:MAG: amino acid adenylation domain-containing protein, partial [bacterium]|nr:amino acid adenylation domain-containing protein [bacterium]
LFSGAVLIQIDKDTLLQGDGFEEFVLKQAVTHLDAVPSFLNSIQPRDDFTRTFNLKRIVSGGEVCPVSLARKWSRYRDFYNTYGPTETTVTAVQTKVPHLDETATFVPIGKPVANTGVYLFDRWMKLVPVGVTGELFIGGHGVARGYLNRPELTAEKFILTASPHSPLYKTGDLAKWHRDGNIEFLGRIDHQVKIRGFRIELGEIENQLLTHDSIKEAVVIQRKDKNGDGYLCAYVASAPGPGLTLDNTELRDYLSHKLPYYMIPPLFVPIDVIPLTPNGKIDRKALPQPRVKQGEEDLSTEPR